MADKRISQLIERTDIANNDVLPIVASGATTTNKVTVSTLQDWMQDNLDVGVTSVGLSVPSAFSVSGSPVTTSGNITISGAGTTAQYIRGDGSLADFPSISGGGSSVSYYLNGSVSQGTIGGVAYRELSKVPILGAGTDFTINANGYIASFITDAGDPSLLEIPGGNWNFETYFQASSGGGSPTFYVELYKVSAAGTATLIATSSGSPELIAFGTNITPYFSSLAVPTTSLTLTDRLAIRYYVVHSGRTITLHTENNTLCQIITTFTTGLTALNGLTAQVQNFATGTSGTDFNISSASTTHTFNLPTASSTNRGALSSADWVTFNGKQNAITLTTTGSSGAATLVGSTLNIPNYTTAMQNQYVPYVGAIGNVTLGANNMSASNVLVDGAATTSGGFLGFKQASSVATGQGGYTSIAAIGTNEIKFSFAQPSNFKEFSFSTQSITAGVSGGRIYTLPDASGTIALTSNLSSYLPLTGGTLTGTLAGTAAVFSGSIDANNGTNSTNGIKVISSLSSSLFTGGIEFLRTTVTAGSKIEPIRDAALGGVGLRFLTTLNNSAESSGTLTTAMTIAPTGGVTLTGALGGTSASFTGSIAATSNQTSPSDGSAYFYKSSSGAVVSGFQFIAETGGAGSRTSKLTIDSTGAATFSSSVNTSGDVIITKSTNPSLILNNSTTTNSFRLMSTDDGTFKIQQTGIANLLSITLSGAATFSSSVTAGGFVSSVSTNGFNLDLSKSAGFGALIQLKNTSSSSNELIRVLDSSNNIISQIFPASNGIAITTGNVGIGTASPSQLIEASKSVNSDTVIQVTNVNTGGSATAQFFASNGTTATQFYHAGTGYGGLGVIVANQGGLYNETSAGLAMVSNNAGGVIRFATGGTTERMRINAGGNVGIGTNNPTRRLQVTAAASEYVFVSDNTRNTSGDLNTLLTLGNNANNTSSYFIVCSVSAGDRMYVYGNGNIVNANGSYGSLSDVKLKENIIDATPKLDDLLKVKIRNYNLIGSEIKQIGVIAQELEEVFPAMIDESEDFEEVEVPQLDEEGNEVLNEEGEVVTTKERISKGTTTKSVKYSVFVPMLIKAIQEQQEIINEMRSEIDSLKTK